MPYTTTAKQFFEGIVPQGLKDSTFANMGGRFEFDIEGPNGGSWLVDLEAKTVGAVGGKKPHCIIKAAEQDFMAVLEGRMSVADGLLTERLHLAGDAPRLAQLFHAFSSYAGRL
jgi:putative sterol carrier protein